MLTEKDLLTNTAFQKLETLPLLPNDYIIMEVVLCLPWELEI